MENSQKSSTLKIIVLILVIGIPVSIIAYLTLHTAPQTDTTNTTPVATTTVGITTSTGTVTMSTYKNGTYTATGHYISPAGPELVPVTITLKDDIITDASFTPDSQAPMSLNFQTKFASGFKPLVIGKDIDTVMLTKVSGSSLTPKGFNDALAQIKVQAQS